MKIERHQICDGTVGSNALLCSFIVFMKDAREINTWHGESKGFFWSLKFVIPLHIASISLQVPKFNTIYQGMLNPCGSKNLHCHNWVHS